MTYTRDSFQQLSETYSSIVEKKVKYYKGEDRDKETGIPKGVKSQTSTKQPKERKQTKPPYESLAASHELQGDVVEDAKMGRASDQELADAHKKFSGMDQSMPSNQFMLKRLNKEINKRKKQKPVSEAKVDAGKSPETKEKDRNVRKFGVSHNVAGHGKLRRSLHKMNRGDKKIPGDKSAWTEMESVQKKDDTYLEPNWEKRKKNNEKARKEMQKDAKDSGYTDIALKASLSKGAGRISEAVKMSKEAWKKTHKDFRNDDEKSPRVLKLNPKTQGTESHPVTFTKEDSEYGYDKDGKSLNPKDKKKEKLPDMRELPTRVNLVKNKLRAMGLKMSQQLTGDQLLEVARYSIENYRVLARVKGGKGKPSQFSYKDEKDANKFADSIKSEGGKATVAKEEVVGEATRLKKEQGYQKGGTKKPSGKKDAALSYVLDKIKKEGGVVIGQGSRQQKKVKGAKSDAGTGKYKRAADEKKQTAADAKEMGYGDNVKGYIETRARYGSKENMKSGRGLGT